MKNIVTLTMNPTIDTSSRVEHVIAERKLRCERPRHEPGGGGLNVSRAIQRLGGHSKALYVIGGIQGQQLRNLLDAEDLEHQPIATDASTRENFIIYEKASERQFRFGMPGPKLTEAEWQRALDDVRSLQPKPDYIVGSGSLPPGVPEDFYAQLADVADDLGARLIVDTSGKPLKLAADRGVYLLKPNVRELKALADNPLEEEAEQCAFARQLVRQGKSEVIVVSLGRGGVHLATKDDVQHLRAPSVPIKSKVGAGDSTVGGIVLGLARDMSLTQAVQFGIAAGAAAVMTPGTELCRRKDAERLFQEMQEA